MRGLVAVLVALAGPAWAEMAPMTGPQIQAALEGRKLQYDNAWQDFRASGRTLYNAGRDSWGYWAVRGDQYCSSWPPGDGWDCYDMARDGDVLRFIAGDGSFTDGVYAE
ncbi:hypothetical protein AIOL_002120 [Candidatus Rhodobacter oscarellae]|uniref:Uncharacterized protein n=1 Tax=Candidatus Rhodobacter oscarellae TaxID=1675527 RepID=A0A0J9E5T5_9RHOB|nr:hypothetical protein [Candidatus Rhodobacter lobularis]KMW57159.1 hypothetical protein AIOL_002120 [Candidatus Rhodobacter lobularis]